MRIHHEFFLTARAALLRALLTAVTGILPYRLWRPLLRASLRGGVPSYPEFRYLDPVLEAVANTDRFLPLGRCLERSLTAWLMLRRHVPSRVRLSVAWRAPGDPFAHACLEVDGRIVLGQPVDGFELRELTP